MKITTHTLILTHSCEEEDTTLEPDAMQALTAIGMETSLRYAIHIITAASLVAKKRKAVTVEVRDVQRYVYIIHAFR